MPHQCKRRLTPVAQRLRREMTPAEAKLWHRLRQSQLGVKFRRQQPVGPYVVDFLCVSAKVVIEIDGESHLEADCGDAERDEFLKKVGMRVLRFWNTEVYENLDGVLEKILEAVQNDSLPSQSPSPLEGEGRGGGQASTVIPECREARRTAQHHNACAQGRGT